MFLRTFILMLLFVQNTFAIFKINKVICTTHDKTFMSIKTCQLKAVKRDVAEFTFRGTILKPAIDNCHIHFELFRKYAIYRPFFVNVTCDACAFIRDRSKYPLTSAIYNTYAKYSNLNHTCPYEGDIILERFAPNSESPFLPIPPAEYLMKTDWLSNEKKFLSVNIWFIYDIQKN